jgi:hypothetical protein
MSTLLEMLFDRANRRLRRLGLLGALIGLPLIVYVEIPLITAAARDEIESVMRGVTRNLRTHERRAPHGRWQPGPLHHGRENRPSR